MRQVRNTIIVIASVALVGIAVNAFAHGGMGWGGGGWGHHGYGMGMHHGGGYGPGYGSQLSEEDYKKFDAQRDAFFRETQEIRTRLYEKERELQAELAKSEPDATRATQIQKEISDLRARFDQARTGHAVEMRKINPNAGGGYGYGGHMMDPGYAGSGYCWR